MSGSAAYCGLLLLDTLSQEAVLASGLFHWPAVKRLISAHLERKSESRVSLMGFDGPIDLDEAMEDRAGIRAKHDSRSQASRSSTGLDCSSR